MMGAAIAIASVYVGSATIFGVAAFAISRSRSVQAFLFGQQV
jgi:hypothetical protein